MPGAVTSKSYTPQDGYLISGGLFFAVLSAAPVGGTVSAVRGFGEVCRQVRLARGKTQVQVAEDARIFQSRVSEIERDAYSPGLELAEALALGLGVHLSDLIAVCEGRLTVQKVVGGLHGSTSGAGRPNAVIELGSVARRLAFEVVRATEELLATGSSDPATKGPA